MSLITINMKLIRRSPHIVYILSLAFMGTVFAGTDSKINPSTCFENFTNADVDATLLDESSLKLSDLSKSPGEMKPTLNDLNAENLSSQCLAIIGSIISFDTSIDSGSGVGNGGGMVEAYFANALIRLDTLVKKALESSHEFDTKETNLLNKISAAIPKEFETHPLLVFKKGDASFIIDGEPKIAYTGLKVGSRIFINQDSLYQYSTNKIRVPAVSYQMAIQILIHELGHHQGEKDDAYLGELGAKVADLGIEKLKGLLNNNGFERVTNAGMPAEWNLGWQNKSLLYSDRTYFARGHASMALGSQYFDGYSYAYQCFIIDSKKTSAIRISALLSPWMSSPQAFGGIGVQIYNQAGQLESNFDGYNYYSFGVSTVYPFATVFGQATWQYKDISFKLSSQSHTACLGFYSFGLGLLRVDDVQIDYF